MKRAPALRLALSLTLTSASQARNSSCFVYMSPSLRMPYLPQPPPARQPAKRGRAVTGAWPVAGRQWCTPVAVSTSFALSLSRFESFSFFSLPFFSFLSLPFFSFFDFFDFFDSFSSLRFRFCAARGSVVAG